MLNILTFFLLLMFGEGALHLVLLIGIGSLIYDFILSSRKRKEQEQTELLAEQLAA